MSRRTERIAKVMQQEIGRIILTDLADPRIDTARTSVTRVQVAEDLLRAKVYVSVMGPEAQQRRALAALARAAGRIQSLLGRRIQLRFLPVLEFLPDEQFKGTMRTWEIIRQAMDEIHAKEAEQARQNDQVEANAPDSDGEPDAP